jgi:hypothetical protein
LYLLHQAIEVPAESCEGGSVEEEEPLGGGAGGRTGRRSPSGGRSGLLVMAQQGNLIIRQAELRIGH